MQKCSIYFVGSAICFLPTSGKVFFIHEDDAPVFYVDLAESSDKILSDFLDEALSHSFLRADAPDMPDFQKVTSTFNQRMDGFREKLGIGKKKFEDSLMHLAVEKDGDAIYFWPHHQDRGRYAFEGACKAEDRPTISANASAEERGDCLRSILTGDLPIS